MDGSNRRSAALLALKFVVLAPVCLVVWLVVLPVYAEIVAYAACGFLRYVMGYRILGVSVDAAGFLNTDTSLTWTLATKESTMSGLGQLMGNMAPFLALVLATPALSFLRRLRIIGIGGGLIFLSHLATVIIRLAAKSPVQVGRTPLTTAIGFISITLPFLLWIVLAYWGQLSAFMGEEPSRLHEKSS